MGQDYAGGTGGEFSSWSGPNTLFGSVGNFQVAGCFISTTKVDNKNISEVQTGDMVSSYNKDKKIIEKSEVIETFKHKDNSGYLIINGRIKATPNHPFYIKRYV